MSRIPCELPYCVLSLDHSGACRADEPCGAVFSHGAHQASCIRTRGHEGPHGADRPASSPATGFWKRCKVCGRVYSSLVEFLALERPSNGIGRLHGLHWRNCSGTDAQPCGGTLVIREEEVPVISNVINQEP